MCEECQVCAWGLQGQPGAVAGFGIAAAAVELPLGGLEPGVEQRPGEALVEPLAIAVHRGVDPLTQLVGDQPVRRGEGLAALEQGRLDLPDIALRVPTGAELVAEGRGVGPSLELGGELGGPCLEGLDDHAVGLEHLRQPAALEIAGQHTEVGVLGVVSACLGEETVAALGRLHAGLRQADLGLPVSQRVLSRALGVDRALRRP